LLSNTDITQFYNILHTTFTKGICASKAHIYKQIQLSEVSFIISYQCYNSHKDTLTITAKL